MNKDQYLQQRAEVFASIQGPSPDPRPCLSLETDMGVRTAAAAVLIPAAVLTIPAAIGVATMPSGLPFLASTVGMSALIASVSGLLPNSLKAFSINQYVLQAAAALADKSPQPVEQERQQAKAWSELNPEVAEAINQWSQAREDQTLSQAEFEAIKGAMREVSNLNQAYEDSGPSEPLASLLQSRRAQRDQAASLGQSAPRPGA